MFKNVNEHILENSTDNDDYIKKKIVLSFVRKYIVYISALTSKIVTATYSLMHCNSHIYFSLFCGEKKQNRLFL